MGEYFTKQAAVIVTVLLLFLEFVPASGAYAMGEHPPEKPKPWEVSQKCPKGSVVHVKIDGHVFELPIGSDDPYITILDEKGEEKTLLPYQYGCSKYQLERQPIEAVYVQYSVSAKPFFGIPNNDPMGFAILGMGDYDHMRLARGKIESPHYSCGSSAASPQECGIEYMYSDRIRVIWEIYKSTPLSEKELASYYDASLKYLKNLEINQQ